MSIRTSWQWLVSATIYAAALRGKIKRIVAALRQAGRLAPVGIAAMILTQPIAFGAISSIGSLANANNKSSSSSWGFATTAQLELDNVAILTLAVDNQDTTDINSALCSSVTDAAGNDWIKAREFTNGQGAADGGATICIFYTKAKANLASGATITANFSTAKTSKAAAAWEFSMNAANILSLAAASDLANDSLDAGSMTLSGLASQEYLFVRGGSVESNGTTYTASTNYTSFTHTASTTSGGGAATNIGARGEFRILTGTTDTTNPTTTASDQASAYIALREAAPPAGGGPRRIFIGQNLRPGIRSTHNE